MATGAVSLLNPVLLSLLSPEQLDGLGSRHFAVMSSKQIAGLGADQVGALRTAQISGFGTQQLAGLDGDDIAALGSGAMRAHSCSTSGPPGWMISMARMVSSSMMGKPMVGAGPRKSP